MEAYVDAGGASCSEDDGTWYAVVAVHGGDAAGDGIVVFLQVGEVELKVSE